MNETVGEVLNSLCPMLFGASEEVWSDALANVLPDHAEQLRDLMDIGTPTVVIAIDPAWRFDGPARLVIFVPGTGAPDTEVQIGKAELTDDIRMALTDFCRVTLGDLTACAGPIHALHQCGGSELLFVADMKGQRIRLVARVKELGQCICLFEMKNENGTVLN